MHLVCALTITNARLGPMVWSITPKQRRGWLVSSQAVEYVSVLQERLEDHHR